MPTKKLTQKPVNLRRRPYRKTEKVEAPVEEVIKTTLYLPAELFYRVAEAALKRRLTKTEVYEEALREWLERHETQGEAGQAGRGGKR